MADPVGISVAPLGAGVTVWTEPPPWQRLDTNYRIRGWQINRGRQSDVGATSTGTASIQLVDGAGNFDPTNPAGILVGLGPLAHAAICLQNPVTSNWATLFRGYVSRVVWEPFQDEQ